MVERRNQGFGQIVGFAAEFMEICSRNSSMTDPIEICTNKDNIMNPAEISSRMDHMADSMEISGKDDCMTMSHARRTKLFQDRDRAQKHAAGYHAGGQYKSPENSRRLKGRRWVARHDQYQYSGGELDDDTKGLVVSTIACGDPRTAVDDCLRFYLIRTAAIKVCNDSSVALRWLGTISIDTKVKMTPRSGVSVDDNEVDGVGDKGGGVGGNSVASTQVSSVLTNACGDPRTAVDYFLRFYRYPDR
ncbi:uncharacterized protein UDID_17976 [Ustilago sp. UG-2017a]|nr:uncharacterized protein UDID_17976 [Ustilago sp. UG-2017a]